MAASTDFINAKLESKGITDVTRDEAFPAWIHIAKHDIDHGVVLRSLTLDHDEPLPVPIIADIAVRRAAQTTDGHALIGNAHVDEVPASGPALAEYLWHQDPGVRHQGLAACFHRRGRSPCHALGFGDGFGDDRWAETGAAADARGQGAAIADVVPSHCIAFAELVCGEAGEEGVGGGGRRR